MAKEPLETRILNKVENTQTSRAAIDGVMRGVEYVGPKVFGPDYSLQREEFREAPEHIQEEYRNMSGQDMMQMVRQSLAAGFISMGLIYGSVFANTSEQESIFSRIASKSYVAAPFVMAGSLVLAERRRRRKQNILADGVRNNYLAD